MDLPITPDGLKISEKCRGCLSSRNSMKCIFNGPFDSLFRDIANIIVSDSDGLPQWICWECVASFRRFQNFKKRLVKSNELLYDYLNRCLPFEPDNTTDDIPKESFSSLGTTETFILELRPKLGRTRKMKDIEIFSMSKPFKASEKVIAEIVPEVKIKPEKSEDEGVDTEDWACEFKYEDLELKLQEADLKDEDEDFDPDDRPLIDKRSRKKMRSPSTKMKKMKKLREKKNKTKYKSKDDDFAFEQEEPKRRNPRKTIEVDPTKIKVIKLSPEEQVVQREQESKNDSFLKFPFKCSLCYKGFNYEQKLENHKRKHDRARGQFKCKLCSMYLPTIYSYHVHESTHSTRYECLKCGKKMIDKTSIMEHYSTVHEGVNITYVCSLCGKSSSNSKTHRGHMRNHHSGDRPKCDQCGKTFINKDSLNEHILIHTGVKNHVCEECGKAFRTKTQVKHHLLKHSDVREFYCVECDMRFKSAHNLKQHLAKSLRHVDLESLKHPCDRCDKRFDSQRSLSHHVQFQHLGRRLHNCPTCGVCLATRNSLMKHVRTAHEGYRAPLKHFCETCGKAFRARAVLIKHIRVHTGEKPYDCEHCGRKFSHRSAMITHVKLVHLKIKRHTNRSKKIHNASNPVVENMDQPTIPDTPTYAIPLQLHPIITVKQESSLVDQRRLLILQHPSECEVRRPEPAAMISVENTFYPPGS